eukprot:5161217-Prorocentrum_lima.AAC.1
MLDKHCQGLMVGLQRSRREVQFRGGLQDEEDGLFLDHRADVRAEHLQLELCVVHPLPWDVRQ